MNGLWIPVTVLYCIAIALAFYGFLWLWYQARLQRIERERRVIGMQYGHRQMAWNEVAGTLEVDLTEDLDAFYGRGFR